MEISKKRSMRVLIANFGSAKVVCFVLLFRLAISIKSKCFLAEVTGAFWLLQGSRALLEIFGIWQIISAERYPPRLLMRK